ncbi:hypothetical protein GUJ93_ZPchr0007g5283 [Zizania palustris]|uniref:peroxidase n=1 Tax=Zizania palustris TaxID=103762 RepID=A0A8J5TDC4_ZIZPA|nr:hypothetical protein GUJ93_ZPchr0007g5283 [Zizania palustris]
MLATIWRRTLRFFDQNSGIHGNQLGFLSPLDGGQYEAYLGWSKFPRAINMHAMSILSLQSTAEERTHMSALQTTAISKGYFTMAASASSLGLLMLAALLSTATAQLSPTFYDTSCPRALSIIKSGVTAAVNSEARMGASLLRLHFHDCFVQGCDASVLLAGNERTAIPNLSLRGFEVIDNIKTQVEAVCKQTVSCADILTVAARDSVVALGGPSWSVPLGRRDSIDAASSAQVANNLPSSTSSLAQLISAYSSKGLSATDMVALSGAHTIGQAQCQSFRNRIYNDTNINSAFATSLQANCPRTSSSTSDSSLAPLDTTTPNAFDNAYYSNLMSQRGLLHSDQELFNGGSADNIVRNLASNPAAFSSAFTTAMVNMGNIAPKTGTAGQIRLSCSRVNS